MITTHQVRTVLLSLFLYPLLIEVQNSRRVAPAHILFAEDIAKNALEKSIW